MITSSVLSAGVALATLRNTGEDACAGEGVDIHVWSEGQGWVTFCIECESDIELVLPSTMYVANCGMCNWYRKGLAFRLPNMCSAHTPQ